MSRPTRRSKDDAVNEAIAELHRTMWREEDRLAHVLQMFSTNEIDILIGQLRSMPDDLTYPIDL